MLGTPSLVEQASPFERTVVADAFCRLSIGNLTQSTSSNSLAGQYLGESQLRNSGSSGNLSHMGGTSPPQLSSQHGSHQFLNQAQFSGMALLLCKWHKFVMTGALRCKLWQHSVVLLVAEMQYEPSLARLSWM